MQRNLPATKNVLILVGSDSETETRPTDNYLPISLKGGGKCSPHARGGKEERPVYFVSRTLQAAKTRYQMIEKVEFALVLTARRMRPYFPLSYHDGKNRLPNL